MIQREVTVNIENGLEARPIAFLVQTASQYDSDVHFVIGEKRVNAKSIMGMMTLGLINGDKIVVDVDGKDEEAALTGIEEYLNGGKKD